MTPYLFLHLEDNYISSDTLNIIHHSEEIHLFQSQHDLIQLQSDNCFIYCFSVEQYKDCLNQGHTPHLCFQGNDIFISPLLTYLNQNYEIFWFPSSRQIHSTTQELIKVSEYLNSISVPICISFSHIFNPEIIQTEGEVARLWLQKLQTIYHNPLKYKEQELLEVERFNLQNTYLYQAHNKIQLSSLVLGIFGDTAIFSSSDYIKHNVTTLLKQSSCVNCEFQDDCIERGLGYIMHQYHYKGCIGIKLFK